MFTNISWANYLVVMTLLLAAYYLFMGIRFYSRELHHLLGGSLKPVIYPSCDGPSDVLDDNQPATTSQDEGPEVGAPESTSLQTFDDTFQEVEQLAARLSETVAEGADKQYDKQGFILLLQLVLKEYPTIKDSPFQSAINELIISECEKHGSIALREEEVVLLWKEVG